MGMQSASVCSLTKKKKSKRRVGRWRTPTAQLMCRVTLRHFQRIVKYLLHFWRNECFVLFVVMCFVFSCQTLEISIRIQNVKRETLSQTCDCWALGNSFRTAAFVVWKLWTSTCLAVLLGCNTIRLGTMWGLAWLTVVVAMAHLWPIIKQHFTKKKKIWSFYQNLRRGRTCCCFEPVNELIRGSYLMLFFIFYMSWNKALMWAYWLKTSGISFTEHHCPLDKPSEGNSVPFTVRHHELLDSQREKKPQQYSDWGENFALLNLWILCVFTWWLEKYSLTSCGESV